jgi:hypothetical protein
MDTVSETKTAPPPSPLPMGALIDTQWIEEEWQGVPLLRCVLCQWDTLNGIHAARTQAQHCPRCAPPADAVVLKNTEELT